MRRSDMKKAVAVLLAVCLTVLMAGTAFAGTWTHKAPAGSGYEDSGDFYWFYIKDNGKYANREWVKDKNIWYWIDEYSSLPAVAGASPDGYLFDSNGVYIDMNDNRRYLTQELYNQLSLGMSFDDAVSILGKPHEISSRSVYSVQSETFTDETYVWYGEKAESNAYVVFTNGAISDYSAYWYSMDGGTYPSVEEDASV